MPALFHAFELSCAGLSRASKIVMLRVGSNSFSMEASVALMMPAPTRTMRGEEDVGMAGFL